MIDDLPPIPIPEPSKPKYPQRGLSENIKAVREEEDVFPPKRRMKRRFPLKSEVPLGNKPGKMLTRTELAEFFGMSVTTLGDWHNMGMPHVPKEKGKGWLYDVGQVLKWRVQHEHDLVKAHVVQAAAEDEEQMSLLEADRREKAAKAQLAELKLANERKLVANIDDMMMNLATACVEIRSGLIALENKLPGLLAHKDEVFIQKKITSEVNNLLTLLSSYKHEYVSDPRNGTDEED